MEKELIIGKQIAELCDRNNVSTFSVVMKQGKEGLLTEVVLHGLTPSMIRGALVSLCMVNDLVAKEMGLIAALHAAGRLPKGEMLMKQDSRGKVH